METECASCEVRTGLWVLLQVSSISQLTVSRLSRQCGILNISQTYRPPRPVKGIALFLFTFKRSDGTIHIYAVCNVIYVRSQHSDEGIIKLRRNLNSHSGSMFHASGLIINYLEQFLFLKIWEVYVVLVKEHNFTLSWTSLALKQMNLRTILILHGSLRNKMV
jgi:hypothetical protein